MICDFTMLCNLQFLNLQECFHMLLFCIITSYCAIHQWYVIAPYCVICNSWIYSNIDYVSWKLQQQEMQNANLQMQITYCMIASYVAMNRWCYDISPCSAICYYEFTGIFLSFTFYIIASYCAINQWCSVISSCYVMNYGGVGGEDKILVEFQSILCPHFERFSFW